MSNNYQSAAPNGSVQQPWGGPFPNLHMWPLHETFSMKMIHLPDSQKVKIGRQTNNKTVPQERNGFFDSKVLSRLHAEVWEHGGKIYIRDIKSSNGTFVNNERLSPEGMESDPYELKNEDLVEFGIDIVSDDNRTIVHHKVAAKVYAVLTTADATLSSRELVHYPHLNRRPVPAMNPNPAASAVMSAGGKAGVVELGALFLKLEDVLTKSKQTGAELQTLAGSMTDIQDTLGGGLPPAQNGSATHLIPAEYRVTTAESKAALAGTHGQQAAAFVSLQNQLSETQTSLNAHIDKIRGLEVNLNHSDAIQLEVRTLREQMGMLDQIVTSSRGRSFARRTDEEYDDDDDDDTRSIATVMDNGVYEESSKSKRRQNGSVNINASGRSIEEVAAQNAELSTQVQTLSVDLSEATRTAQHLQSQHDEAMAAVKILTQRIGTLETGLASRIADAVTESDKKWENWRVHVEDGWKKERESWESERERLRGVVRDWEETSRRANEEEEDRSLNERLSEGSSEEDLPLTAKASGSQAKKPRRRRPSQRTTLAVRALREMAKDGSSTPTQHDVQLHPRSGDNGALVDVEQEDGAGSVQSDKSTESGKDSVDTLRDRDALGKRNGELIARKQTSVPLFTVVVVAVIAGAIYYRHKE